MRAITVGFLACISIGAGFLTLDCLNKKSENKQIYAFTEHYESQKNVTYPLTKIQQETVNQVVESYELFLTEQETEEFPIIGDFSKKHDWSTSFVKEYQAQHKYYAKMNDGSNVSILFQHFKNDSESTHRIVVWNLNEIQCNYLIKHYTLNQKIHVESVAYTFTDKEVSIIQAPCSDLNDLSKTSTAIMLTYNGKIYGKDYPKNSKELNSHIALLANENYETFIKNYAANLYFTDKPVTYKEFYSGIDYAVNPNTKHVFAGALTKDECKRLIYNLPSNVQYKVNGENKCLDNLNTIEFFKQG
jgi:hypothetical protein